MNPAINAILNILGVVILIYFYLQARKTNDHTWSNVFALLICMNVLLLVVNLALIRVRR